MRRRSREAAAEPARPAPTVVAPPAVPGPIARVWQDPLGRAGMRSAQILLVLAVAWVVTDVAIRLRLLVIPLLIATLIAAAANPLVDWLDRRRFVPRSLAVIGTMLAGLALLGGLGWWIGAAVASQWQDLRRSAVEGLEQLRDYLVDGPLPIDPGDLSGLQERAREFLSGAQVQQGAITGATAVLEFLTGLFLGIVLLFFLLRDGRRIWGFIADQLPARQRDRWHTAATRASGVLGGYVRGTAVVATVDALVIGIGLVVVGVPLALPLAVAVFLGAFIPLVGATLAGALAALVALVSNGPVTALIVVGIVVAVNQLEGDLLYPVVMGQALALHPLAILLALTAGTIVAGVVGAILAVPFAAVAWVVVKTFREARAREPVDPAGSGR
ncbi:AI-2E family transporter [Nocardioides pakistanensis]